MKRDVENNNYPINEPPINSCRTSCNIAKLWNLVTILLAVISLSMCLLTFALIMTKVKRALQSRFNDLYK